MKPFTSNITNGIQAGTLVDTCDNSGAKILRIISVKNKNTVKKRRPQGGIGDLVVASVVKGKPEIRKQVVLAIIVRQRKEFQRADGTRVQFEDNAAVVVKDDAGNPKGTIFKGPIAKEVAGRWPFVAKVASILV